MSMASGSRLNAPHSKHKGSTFPVPEVDDIVCAKGSQLNKAKDTLMRAFGQNGELLVLKARCFQSPHSPNGG